MPKVKAPTPDMVDKERQVIELRRAGATFDDIARAIGYKHPSGAQQAYARALKRVLVEAGSEEVREMELDRLDRLQRSVWPQAVAGDINSVNTVLRIMHRRAQYLGLDAPIKQEVRVDIADSSSIDAEVARLIEMLAANDLATQ